MCFEGMGPEWAGLTKYSSKEGNEGVHILDTYCKNKEEDRLVEGMDDLLVPLTTVAKRGKY